MKYYILCESVKKENKPGGIYDVKYPFLFTIMGECRSLSESYTKVQGIETLGTCLWTLVQCHKLLDTHDKSTLVSSGYPEYRHVEKITVVSKSLRFTNGSQYVDH